MDLLKMQYYKDVYENKSFTKAADVNFVHQSTVTQQIAAIEKELGALLFTREHGKITPTPAGEIFYQDCLIILEKYASAYEKIKKTPCFEPTGQKKITIGFSGFLDKNLVDRIHQFLKQRADINVEFVDARYSVLCDKLFNQEIDIICGTACRLEALPDTVWNVLFTSPQKILIASSNPLAKENTVTMDELKDMILYLPSYDMMPSCHRKGLQLPKRTKYKMNIEFVNSFESILLKVSCNQGVTFASDSFENHNDTITKISVKDDPFVCTLGVSYLKNHKNPLVDNFMKCIIK